ncbi:hypothetical protein ANO14919_056120 [Xylariales sp. No.14919]|nr:hypothetical protein ANO14919_056120 [Xylariales sp. No.14919]
MSTLTAILRWCAQYWECEERDAAEADAPPIRNYTFSPKMRRSVGEMCLGLEKSFENVEKEY